MSNSSRRPPFAALALPLLSLSGFTAAPRPELLALAPMVCHQNNCGTQCSSTCTKECTNGSCCAWVYEYNFKLNCGKE